MIIEGAHFATDPVHDTAVLLTLIFVIPVRGVSGK